jgi:hypothetical protein
MNEQSQQESIDITEKQLQTQHLDEPNHVQPLQAQAPQALPRGSLRFSVIKQSKLHFRLRFW